MAVTCLRSLSSLLPTLLLLISCLSYTIAEDLSSLKFVHVLFRHGDRTPIDEFPNDMYKDYWTDGLGQLTNIGKQQHYELGAYFRKRYSTFLNETYSRTEITVRSTDVDRTLMSAQCNLAGLYPPKGNQTWEATLNWQPIPVHTIPVAGDFLLSDDSVCPRFQRLFEEVKTSPEAKKFDEEMKDFYGYLMNATGIEVKDVFTVSDLYDVLFCQQSHGLKYPSWADSATLAKMKRCRYLDFDYSYKTKEMRRLRGGYLLGQIIENMQKKIEGSLASQKMILYSAHDMTIMALLNVLYLYDGIFPPYAAAVLVELHENNGSNIVKILYKNDTKQEEPTEFFLSNCSKPCTFEEFRRLTQDMIPEDIAKECSDSVFDSNITLISAIAGSVLGCTLLMLIVLAYAFYRRNRDTYRYFNINTDNV